ncbi:MAG: histidine--tRNA ligase [Alphaproteobacteria bacterium]|nr:histidine--tRNA ligase [Alphaproteobacteria bacterium]MDE2335690.1 histidine--tRNA ligase [Alphaproteobacteria bacterium]
MSETKIYKPKQISGFPEWLPEYRAVELGWMDKIRSVFERYGFCNIETPSVEEVDALLAKGGETEKEIYTLTRLQEDAHDKDSRLALHFDLTVPMARYVAQRFNDLVFPFKRYQIQKSWRGERPQKGRFREFYQCDIDVVNVDGLPLHFDAELPAVMFEAYQALDIPPVEMHISNRKIIVGYLQGLGVKDIAFVTRELDKLDKIGVEKVTKILTDHLGDAALAEKCLAVVQIKNDFAAKTRALGVKNDLLEEGLRELDFVMDNLQHLPKGSVIADLGIIRGLDYYTGTVIEVRFKDKPLSIGGGGRYDNLAGSFISQKLPGIGVSIGLTRLFAMLLDEGYIKPAAKCPTQVLVVLPSEERRTEAAAAAQTLRRRGFNVELFHSDTKIKKQLSYAEKKGIPYVWFPPFEDGQPHEVKNMADGKQSAADPSVWKI